MRKIEPKDLLSLESYARERQDYRKRMIMHKARRTVRLGENISLLFEDRLTMLYQIQEVLRAEKVFEAEGIQEELAAYNPLIPDGSNWKTTMLIEFTDSELRKIRLGEMRGIDRMVWVEVGGHKKIFAISDEDLERENEEKTSAVHFLRFELDPESLVRAKAAMPVRVGCEHPQYVAVTTPPEAVREAIVSDLD